MRALNKLSAAQVKNAAPGKHSDGGGLWLHRRPDGGSQWFLRVTIHGRRREMGLGSLTYVSLKEARETAEKWRAVARQGKDPIKEREKEKRLAARADHTLAIVAAEAFEARKAELKGDGKAGRWFSPLELHILPKIGQVPIEEIDQQDIKNTLAPIWHAKADTARKAMNRLGIVMRHAAAMGLNVDVQATEKAKALLGKSRHKPKHLPALDWREVPTFYASLDEGTVTHLALRLLILTAARSSEIRFCNLSEIENDTWIIPAERMKTGKEHRIPLSKEAMAVVEQAKPFERGGFLFPSVRKGVISDATMSRYMERRGMKARPHGFRSSFRTWCAEATDTPREVAETALAHVVGGSVERAYRRTDYLDQRRVLMERWADHVTAV
ncbi:site-specific integrase [Pseudohalocynthiibacter sp. F2068]|jgi:integrase|uniref:tyrosine-type recombinase/integrase n=1 Tax=Pseudohalocynthiibacter sp. F2068 TaxID=2926418 RepID=UPI001FF3E782|nr:site-specific integrase [Pseudohalocynthiibacter sp. F2068]MCK0102758.1 integrase arm-type DNA-binding domain-containing protein [Pseudohalocynthiibacter sp. F2068]